MKDFTTKTVAAIAIAVDVIAIIGGVIIEKSIGAM
jgi:hypothetical protein